VVFLHFTVRKNDKLYFGSTKDLKNRINLHNNGSVMSTKYRLPLKLIYYEAYSEESTARKREHTVKSSRGSRTALLKRINIIGA